MRLTKRNQLKVPKELRKEDSVMVTKSLKLNTLLMFSVKSWSAFYEKLPEECKGGGEKPESPRRVRRHYLACVTQMWPDSRDYVCIGYNEDLLAWFGERPGVGYEISYWESDDCYVFTNISVENGSIERILP